MASLLLALLAVLLHVVRTNADEQAGLRAGAAEVDITPAAFPVIVNGMFEQRSADRAHDRLMARALVLDDGQTRLALVVVDNLMLPRGLLDEAKELARRATGIPTERMLISATHTHSAPSAMGCLGSDADPAYPQFVMPLIARGIVLAAERLAPAKLGWKVVENRNDNHCRRWIFRPDRMATDPFGERNVRAHMHPGHQTANHVGPSGPADQDLTLLAVQTRDGRPLACFVNYAMHYFGSPPVSADVGGRFGGQLARRIGAERSDPAFIGILSQGTSGDSMWMNYGEPRRDRSLDEYADSLAKFAEEAYRAVEFRSDVSLAMAETTFKLRRRVPDEARLAKARAIVTAHGNRPWNNLGSIYAREQIFLHDAPDVELKLQAVRIGELAITALPNEVYGITGWKLKARSPLPVTLNVELANGAEGYIPPPEQHELGGYTTWPARTAGLEETAEPKIVDTLVTLLEKVAGRPRRELTDEPSAYSRAVLAARPTAYWRLGEIDGHRALDATGNPAGQYEPGVARYLSGDDSPGLASGPRSNRAAHFAGGRMTATVAGLGDTYSVEGWLWNGLPNDARAVTGYFFSRGPNGDRQVAGDHVGLGGTYKPEWAGKLLVFNGNGRDEALAGRTTLAARAWHHVAFVRRGTHVAVYLNGQPQPDLSGELASTIPAGCQQVFVGGRSDNQFNWEGKLDELALFDRALDAPEIAAHYASAERPAPRSAPPDPPPLSPQDSLRSMRVRPGFEVELVASEPLVADPVAIDWGPDGKLWVAEMADYPLGIDGQGKAGGRIRFLEDTDGDGRIDRSTLFLENVNFPTGVLAWGKGVLVTAAPEIFYAEDADGDGRADARQTLLSGFLAGNQQLRVNGLRVGLDRWVYCANGGHFAGYGAASRIRSHRTGEEIAVGSRDFRFQPETGRVEPLAGPSQFGRNRDDWGHWFGVQNSHPLWHYVLEDRYTSRNPHVVPPDPKQRLFSANPPVYSAKPPEKRFHNFQESGRFTSACSGMVFRDARLFSDGVRHAFTCEPFHNLVQHNLLSDEGVSFRASRDPAEADREFLASTDHWCRPVMVVTGPDGSLWVVDMYRFMIEHPEWLPPGGQEKLRPFYRSGDDRGRIYRVFPQGKRPAHCIPRFDRLSTENLVETLGDPNGWRRDMAQRLLVERRDASAAPLLAQLSGSDSPLARLHALWTLDGLERLTVELLTARLHDPHPEIRRNAILLSEKRTAEAATLLPELLRLAADPDPKVRLQLASSLGAWSDPRTAPALARLAIDGEGDKFLSAAVKSSIAQRNAADVLGSILERTARDSNSSPQLVDAYLELAIQLGADEGITPALDRLREAYRREPAAWQFRATAGVLAAIDRRGPANRSASQAAWRERLREIETGARQTLAEPRADDNLRAAAVDLLGREPARRNDDRKILCDLLMPQTPQVVQLAVVDALTRENEPATADLLLSGWNSHGPVVRGEILGAIASRPAWVERLVARLEEGRLSAAAIDAPMRERLLEAGGPSLRPRLVERFAQGTADRRDVLADYQAALTTPGDVTRGRRLFETKCATCHKLNGQGHEVGPDLAALSNKSVEALFIAILDPSRAVDSKYGNYVAATTDGRIVSGILATETGVSVTLLSPDGKRHDILRSDLESLRSSGKSLMPEGLEKDLSVQDLADLIAHVAASTAEGGSPDYGEYPSEE